MKKKYLNRLIAAAAVFSMITALAEGLLFYAEYRNYPLFYVLMILFNGIKAFGFDAAVDIEDALEFITVMGQGVRFIGYMYVIALFLAPLCTIAAVYKLLTVLFRFRGWFGRKKERKTVIFGYGKAVGELLTADSGEKTYATVVAKERLSDEDRMKLAKRGAAVVYSDMEFRDEKAFNKFAKKIRLDKAENILLFDPLPTQNLKTAELLEKYTAFADSGVKVYALTEDAGTRELLAEVFSADGMMDPELVRLPEITVRKMFRDHPAELFFKERLKTPENCAVHLLIVGFDELGQEIARQAAVQCILDSGNDIVIDVFSPDASAQSDAFLADFAQDYVVREGNTARIEPPDADGRLVFRFTEQKPGGRSFAEQLENLWQTMPLTYAVITVSEREEALHTLALTEDCLYRHGALDVPVGLLTREELYEAEFLDRDSRKYGNVFAMDGKRLNVSLREVLNEEVDREAKAYNLIYNRMRICSGKDAADEEEIPDAEKAWKKMRLFQKNSSRMLCSHSSVKRHILEADPGKLEKLKERIGENGTVLRMRNSCFIYDGTEEEIAAALNGDPLLKKLMAMEHRRWCYAMAVSGWRYGSGKKNELLKTNPCMTDWDTLCREHPDMCKYDLMPFLMFLKK